MGFAIPLHRLATVATGAGAGKKRQHRQLSILTLWLNRLARESRAMAAARWIRAFAVASVGLVLAVAAFWNFPSQRLLVDQLEREIPDARAEEAARHLRQLARLGDPGLRSVVEAMASTQVNVSESAAQILQTQMREWRQLPIEQSSVRVFLLARLLSERVDQFEPAARRVSAQLAGEILLWPIDRDVVDGVELVNHCEVAMRSRPPATPPSSSGQLTVSDVEELLPEAQAIDTAPAAPFLQGGAEPGYVDVLPVPYSITDGPSGLTDEPMPPPEPHWIRVATPLHDTRRPTDQQTTRQATPSAQDGRAAAERLDDLSINRNFPKAKRPSQLSDLQVMYALSSNSEFTAISAEQELLRRGYRELDIRLARYLVDPDPEVRIRFVNSLPELVNVDSRPWPLRLTHDRDARVRRTAAGVLGTSRDPTFRKRLLELESEETDPDVLRQVRRSLEALQR
jgi:hypothetical protein